MPYNVCGRVVTMSEDSCAIFSRNQFDVLDLVELHVMMKDYKEKCVCMGRITNVDRKGEAHTDNVWSKDDGWVYNVQILGEHDNWKNVFFQFLLSNR